MIFRLSQKLNTKIKAGKLSELPLDANPYADWSCHVFTSGRTQYILLCNTKSLYSCVMAGKGITNSTIFVERATGTLEDWMDVDGQVVACQQFVEASSEGPVFAKALNRSVTGSMNDLIHAAKWLLADGLDLRAISFQLNETPLSMLGYRYPREAFKELAGELGGG